MKALLLLSVLVCASFSVGAEEKSSLEELEEKYPKLRQLYLDVSQLGTSTVDEDGKKKPTKYHYYPHNQHIYLLPECAAQQVCNAVYVRLNFTQPLCACPTRFQDPCSASILANDRHTVELVTDKNQKALTLVKTCELVSELRDCKSPKDWSVLALQNVRTGKSHYLMICKCPKDGVLEGPLSHDKPAYAQVPGIRVYGMLCVSGSRASRNSRMARWIEPFLPNRPIRAVRKSSRALGPMPQFPWKKALTLARELMN